MAKLIGLEEMKKELENLKGEKYRVTINDSIISSGYVDEVVLENGRLIVKSRTGNGWLNSWGKILLQSLDGALIQYSRPLKPWRKLPKF